MERFHIVCCGLSAIGLTVSLLFATLLPAWAFLFVLVPVLGMAGWGLYTTRDFDFVYWFIMSAALVIPMLVGWPIGFIAKWMVR